MTLTTQYAARDVSLVSGGPRLFEQFARDYLREEPRFQHVANAVEPFLSRMQTWVGIQYKGKLVATTPLMDDSALPPRGNERIKSTSGIHPFVRDENAAYALFNVIGEKYGHATRDADVRVPVGGESVQRMFAVVGVEKALAEHGYVVEARHPRLFDLQGQLYPVNEYGTATQARLAQFPEGAGLIDDIERTVVRKTNGKVLLPQEMKEHVERVGRENYIARLEPKDVQGALAVHKRTFTVYGTYPIEDVLPRMATDRSPTAPIAVMARERTRHGIGRVTGLVVLEKYPYGFVEITDVCSVDPETGKVISNGSALAMVHEAARIATGEGYVMGYSDNVPLRGMNSLSRRVGHQFVGVHPVQVALSTEELEQKIGRQPTYVDLLIWSGSIQFDKSLVKSS